MGASDPSTDRGRTERPDHVCVFCGEQFDVSRRRTCPACEATVVVRGGR